MGGQWRELQGPPINNFLEVIPKTLLKGMTSFKKIRPSHLNSLSLKLQLLAPFKQSPGRFLVKATKIEEKISKPIQTWGPGTVDYCDLEEQTGPKKNLKHVSITSKCEHDDGRSVEKTPRTSHQQFRWGHSKDLIEGHDVIQKNKTLTFKSLSSKLYLHGSTGSCLSSITKSAHIQHPLVIELNQPPFCTDDQKISLKSLKKRHKKRNDVQTMKSLSYFCISTRFTHIDRFSSKPKWDTAVIHLLWCLLSPTLAWS